MFPKAKLIQSGGENVEEYIDIMRESILKKNGIVPDDSKQDFLILINQCMSRAVIASI